MEKLIEEPLKNSVSSLEEKWENAGLANGFIFYKVMRDNPDACKKLLEILLHIQIEKIQIIEEETILSDKEAKGIRLDLYIKDETHVFDVELQIKDTKELPERARYYQGLMDVDSLKISQHYSELKTSYVIFICMTDIFQKGLPVYHFENLCTDDTSIKMNDRSYKVFFIANNCDKIIKDKEQKAFLNFLLTNIATDDYTKHLQDYVALAKKDVQWRHAYMEWERQRMYDRDEARAEGRAEGREEGIAEGRAEGIAEGITEGRAEGIAEGITKGNAEGRAEGTQQTRLETAKNLLQLNLLSTEQIATVTGLSCQQINELK